MQIPGHRALLIRRLESAQVGPRNCDLYKAFQMDSDDKVGFDVIALIHISSSTKTLRVILLLYLHVHSFIYSFFWVKKMLQYNALNPLW